MICSGAKFGANGEIRTHDLRFTNPDRFLDRGFRYENDRFCRLDPYIDTRFRTQLFLAA